MQITNFGDATPNPTERFPRGGGLPTHREMPVYPFSNDSGLDETFNLLDQFVSYNPHGDHDVALLIGSGALFTFLPLLPEKIYIADHSRPLLSWIEEQKEAINKSNGRSDYLEWLHDHILKPYSIEFKHSYEVARCGSKHFTSNDRSFLETKDKLQTVDIRLSHVDFRDRLAAESLANCISEQGDRIKVANFTNLHNYAASHMNASVRARNLCRILGTTARLPFADTTFVFGTMSISNPIRESNFASFARSLFDMSIDADVEWILDDDDRITEADRLKRMLATSDVVH